MEGMTNLTSTQRAEFKLDLAAKPYSVTLWGSNPDTTDNDDCWTGDEFATREEAIACYRALVMFPTEGQLAKACGYDWEHVMLDGPDVHEVSANPDQATQRRHRRERTGSDADWQREQATQAGMAFGCDGYNDAMGW
jgi:hypothetical protein